MNLLNISNHKFYLLMIVVIGILIFIELKEGLNDFQMKNDLVMCKILIFVYSFLTLAIFILNIIT